MRVIDVPIHPAYLVFHDAFSKGAMDIYPSTDLLTAQQEAEKRNKFNEECGNDDAGTWKAYTKLPRVRIHKFHPAKH